VTLVPRRGGMSPCGTRSTDDSHKRSEEVEHNVRCEHRRSMLRRSLCPLFGQHVFCSNLRLARAAQASLSAFRTVAPTQWRGRAQCSLRAPTVHAAQGRFRCRRPGRSAELGCDGLACVPPGRWTLPREQAADGGAAHGRHCWGPVGPLRACAFRSRALELQDVALAASRHGEQAGRWLGPVDVTEQDAAE